MVTWAFYLALISDTHKTASFEWGSRHYGMGIIQQAVLCCLPLDPTILMTLLSYKSLGLMTIQLESSKRKQSLPGCKGLMLIILKNIQDSPD